MRYISLFLILVLIGCKSNKSTSDAAPVAPTQSPPTSETQTTEPLPSLQSTIWTVYSEMDLPDIERRIHPSAFDLWECNYDAFQNTLSESPVEVILPFRKELILFDLENSGTMSEALAEKFPHIKSYKGLSKDQKISVRVDTNDEGLFVEYKDGSEIVLLSPYLDGSKTFYAIYPKSAIKQTPRDEGFEK